MRTILAIICIASFVSGCASVRGIPPTLENSTRADLASGELPRVLNAAGVVLGEYETRRNANLEYVYWSNVPYVPLAATAAGGLYYKAHKDLIAGVGIVAASLAGFNTFTNARANAKVYQQGVNALECVYQKLSPFQRKNSDDLSDQADSMDGLLEQARDTLASAEALTFKTPAEDAEIKKDPSVVSNLATQIKQLAKAITDATKSATDAHAEVRLYAGVGSFAGDAVRRVNAIVGGKISVVEIDYSALKTAIGNQIPQKAATDTASTTPKKAMSLTASASQTPIATTAAEVDAMAKRLAKAVQVLDTATAEFAVGVNEKAVNDCITAAFP